MKCHSPIILITIILLVFSPDLTALKIKDYQKNLNRRFIKHLRKSTKFIIIHSTEGSLPSSLRTLSKGKVRRRRYISRGGHANYLIAKNGMIYRILNPKYRANHAGISMWNGLQSLSSHSLGIELEGYHNIPFTNDQYKSLKELLRILQKRYQIKDRNVLEHYRIAYSRPNRLNKKHRRGRKRDPGINNFDRERAGLNDEYQKDPDVIAGRISGSSQAISISRKIEHKRSLLPVKTNGSKKIGSSFLSEKSPGMARNNIITATRTAWKIAGSHYKSATTSYRFPNGTVRRGHRIKDWSTIPIGTAVNLNVEEEKIIKVDHTGVLLPQITEKLSAKKIANALHNASFTFYLYPNGKILSGQRINQFSDLPIGTKVLIAYRRIVTPKNASHLGENLDDVYLSNRTLYIFPNRVLKSGEQIDNFSKIPKGTVVFEKVR